MNTIDEPVIQEIECSDEVLHKLREELERGPKERKKLLLDYPTVYLYHSKSSGEYEVYVGETSDIIRRTNEHLHESHKGEEHWEAMIRQKPVKMFILGHNHFNKSLTLDIEHRMMLYLSGAEKVKRVHNRRGNRQNEYYTSEELNGVFSKLWRKLGNYNPELFPLESIIMDSALFKASPFHKLTQEQNDAKREIMEKIGAVLRTGGERAAYFHLGRGGNRKDGTKQYAVL